MLILIHIITIINGELADNPQSKSELYEALENCIVQKHASGNVLLQDTWVKDLKTEIDGLKNTYGNVTKCVIDYS